MALASVAAGILNERRLPDPSNAPDEAKSHPRPGDVLLFYHPRRGRDYFIRWFTRSPFYHAALYAGDDHVIEARPQGVIDNSLAGRERDFLVAPAPRDKGEEALAWAKTQIGDPYDRLDALVIVLEHIFTFWHINYAPPGRYTCAGLVADAFEHSGFKPFPKQSADETTPADWSRYLPSPWNQQYGTSE